LTIAAAAATLTCSSSLVGPRGETPAAAVAKSGVSYVTTPVSFNFDGLGQPVTSAGTAQATQTIQVTNAANTITIETGTGYVHE
jgi:MSHA pilin protein MshC